jgi:hypothetical protein
MGKPIGSASLILTPNTSNNLRSCNECDDSAANATIADPGYLSLGHKRRWDANENGEPQPAVHQI